MLAALALLLAQSPALDVTATVDRERAAVGEQVVFTLKAIGHSTAPFRVDLPALDGFAMVDRRERTDVVTTAREITRAFTLELTLRAEQVGTWEIGPIRVEHGDASAFSPVAIVMVVNAAGGPSAGLDADLLALIPRVPSPRQGGPSVYVVTSGDVVYAGDQVNVLTAAWLPRGLRLRLRQPPSLTPPALPGVFSTPRSSVPGAVASRVVDGETYDLFVGFQTAYPLNPGPLTIPTARLTWVQPGPRPSNGDDRRQSVESSPTVLVVRPLPGQSAPAGFDGPVARALSIEYRLGQASARAGAALQVELVLNGAGNLPLWPTPRVTWPAGARVYEEGTEGAARPIRQWLGGSKTFRFAVVPDSAGSLALPPLEYSYFDPGAGAYRTARTPGVLIPVLEAAPMGDRRSPVPVEYSGAPAFAERVMSLPAPLVALLFAGPVLALLAGAWYRRRPRLRRLPPPQGDPAARLERLMASLVTTESGASPEELVASLREAGLERDRAEHLVELHRALEVERFSASGTGRAPPDLLHAIEAALKGIPRRVLRVPRLATSLLVVLGALAGATGLSAQTGVQLYTSGEYDAAARAFRSAAGIARGPSPALWYDVAASEYMARQDAQAVAALLLVRAHAPRDPHAEALWNALAREHDQLRRADRVWPFTAEESFLTALGLLWIAAIVYLLLGTRRPVWLLPLVAAGIALAVGLALRSERSVHRGVLVANSSLRLSPHGLAPERGTVPAFSIVRLVRKLNGWRLVETGDGSEGWVPEDILAVTPPLN